MKLWTFELRKILITRKVLLVFLAALVLRTIFLFFFPELKDERIRLTQKQYNAFLMELQGENNPDKEQFVRSSYEKCREVTECFAEMQDMHENRLITEEVWQKYTLEYEEAMLSRNALSIFYEKEEAFRKQPKTLKPAHYFYEYGWQTVFTLQLYPDLFLLAAVLALSCAAYLPEKAGGMLMILFASRFGRERLFFIKLSAVMTAALGMMLAGSITEVLVFYFRGFLKGGTVPMHSLTLFSENRTFDLSLNEAYLLTLTVRTVSAVLFSGLVCALSLLLFRPETVLFAALSLLLLPLFLIPEGTAESLCSYGVQLSGSRMLRTAGTAGYSILPPLLITALYTSAVILTAVFAMQTGRIRIKQN